MDLKKSQSQGRSSNSDSGASGEIGAHPDQLITPNSPWYDAFKPASFKRPTDFELGCDTSKMTQLEKTHVQLSQVSSVMSRRHLAIVTASAGVGTGLFIGTGNTLSQSGPAGLIIAFGVMGLSLILVMMSTAEMNLRYHTVNPMSQLTTRFLDPSLGFSVGYIYMFGFLVAAPLEVIAGAELTQYWHGDNNPGAKVNPVAWVAIIYVFIVFLHFFGGSRGFAELEFFVGAVKLIAIFGWIIFSVIYVAGGIGPDHTYIGAKYFHDPGSFTPAGFKGVVSAWISAALAYGGTEVTSLAAGESANPLRAIPSSTKQTMWRSVCVFVLPVILIGFSIPYTDKLIGSSNSGSGSPFVRSIQLAGIHALPSIFNAVIMISVIGVSNVAVYGSSRTLVSLSITGMAPKCLSYIDRRGRPIVATTVVLIFTALCFVAGSDKYNEVFNWLYAFAQLAFLYVWVAISLVHIKFRLLMRRQGRSLSELLYVSPLGITGAVIGGGICLAIFALQFWPAASPVGGSSDRAQYFFQMDLSVPTALCLFFGHKIYTRVTTGNWGFIGWDLDLDEGVRQIDADAVLQNNEDLRLRMKKNFLYRMAYYLC